MTYDPVAKTYTPTDWKALWISFGDGAFSKKNDSHGSDLYFNRSSWRGECGLSNDGTCLRFRFFAWDAVVKMNGLLMLQKYQSQAKATGRHGQRKKM
jgi:hypothetical protein